MAVYKVGADGKSPQLGLKAGDKVVTGGGTYTINADGSKTLDKSVTTGNYNGSYNDVDYTQNLNYLMNNGGSATDVAKQVGNLETKLGNSPNLVSNSNQTALANAYAYIDKMNSEQQKGYDPSQDPEYQAAMEMLRQAQANQPTYNNPFAGQLSDLYNQIVNRDPFNYDVNEDALYQQYARMYSENGRRAMEDTMGQTASLNGGYGSSYGSTASQQEYDRYMQQLNNVIPELYNQKYNEYQNEGQGMFNQFALLNQMASDDYNKYLDSYNMWNNNLNFAANNLQNAYDRGYQNWAAGMNQSNADREYQLAVDKFNYQKQQDATKSTGSGVYTPKQEQSDEIPQNVTITNNNGKGWVAINGTRYSYQELEAMVDSGKVKETYNKNNNTVTYTLVK